MPTMPSEQNSKPLLFMKTKHSHSEQKTSAGETRRTLLGFVAVVLLCPIVIPLAIAAVAPKLAPYSAKFPGEHTLENPGGEIPKLANAFAPFKDTLGISWDNEFLYIEGNGLPDHPMMKGITAWQQQVPLPHDFTGENRFKLPLEPEFLEEPGDLTLIGPIAVAVNGIPIFHALTQSGKDAYAGGELDEWGGHCGRADDYHYHIAPKHLEAVVGEGNPIAFGLDGYPIYAADPSKDKPLDECHGYFDDEGNYRYVGELKPPYVMSYFRGKADLEDRPPTRGVRPFLPPLRGAEITGFEGSLLDGFKLSYEIAGKEGNVEYQVTGSGGADFTFHDTDGSVREESYERRAGGGGGDNRRPPGGSGNPEMRTPDGKGKGRPPEPARGGGGQPRPDPLAEALDVNRDGVIDTEELAGAEKLLRKLDRDGDGKLSREEATGRKGGGKGGERRQK